MCKVYWGTSRYRSLSAQRLRYRLSKSLSHRSSGNHRLGVHHDWSVDLEGISCPLYPGPATISFTCFLFFFMHTLLKCPVLPQSRHLACMAGHKSECSSLFIHLTRPLNLNFYFVLEAVLGCFPFIEVSGSLVDGLGLLLTLYKVASWARCVKAFICVLVLSSVLIRVDSEHQCIPEHHLTNQRVVDCLIYERLDLCNEFLQWRIVLLETS